MVGMRRPVEAIDRLVVAGRGALRRDDAYSVGETLVALGCALAQFGDVAMASVALQAADRQLGPAGMTLSDYAVRQRRNADQTIAAAGLTSSSDEATDIGEFLEAIRRRVLAGAYVQPASS